MSHMPPCPLMNLSSTVPFGTYALTALDSVTLRVRDLGAEERDLQHVDPRHRASFTAAFSVVDDGHADTTPCVSSLLHGGVGEAPCTKDVRDTGSSPVLEATMAVPSNGPAPPARHAITSLELPEVYRNRFERAMGGIQTELGVRLTPLGSRREVKLFTLAVAGPAEGVAAAVERLQQVSGRLAGLDGLSP